MDLNIPITHCVPGAMDAAMRAQFGNRITGVTVTRGQSMRVNFDGEYSNDEALAAYAITGAHDPAVITASRDGDVVTVTVSKPRNVDNATEARLIIDGVADVDMTALDTPVQIVDAEAFTISVEGYPCEEVEI